MGYLVYAPEMDAGLSTAGFSRLGELRAAIDAPQLVLHFQPWLDQVIHFPEEVMDRAWKRIPPEWIEGDEDALQRLLERLFERRKRLPELIAACRSARAGPFPNWQPAE